jgi:hypothetical protein
MLPARFKPRPSGALSPLLFACAAGDGRGGAPSGMLGRIRYPCRKDEIRGLIAPLRPCDLRRLRARALNYRGPSALRPWTVFRHRLRQTKGHDPFIMRAHPEPVCYERGCKSLSAPAIKITGEIA